MQKPLQGNGEINPCTSTLYRKYDPTYFAKLVVKQLKKLIHVRPYYTWIEKWFDARISVQRDRKTSRRPKSRWTKKRFDKIQMKLLRNKFISKIDLVTS